MILIKQAFRSLASMCGSNPMKFQADQVPSDGTLTSGRNRVGLEELVIARSASVSRMRLCESSPSSEDELATVPADSSKGIVAITVAP